uniref:Glycosyltransferase family 92 protein n=1 Tax=Steinernema glaseri TaxID=37863 RepID=A0A1I7ZNJ2_9BILA
MMLTPSPDLTAHLPFFAPLIDRFGGQISSLQHFSQDQREGRDGHSIIPFAAYYPQTFFLSRNPLKHFEKGRFEFPRKAVEDSGNVAKAGKQTLFTVDVRWVHFAKSKGALLTSYQCYKRRPYALDGDSEGVSGDRHRHLHLDAQQHMAVPQFPRGEQIYISRLANGGAVTVMPGQRRTSGQDVKCAAECERGQKLFEPLVVSQTITLFGPPVNTTIKPMTHRKTCAFAAAPQLLVEWHRLALIYLNFSPFAYQRTAVHATVTPEADNVKWAIN